MASEAGGRSNKLGNEYERLWAVRHVVELLSGRALAVQIEPAGDDERGTEFWVARPDGTREAHQCKRENGSKGRWTVADLSRIQVLQDAKFQLDRSPVHRFCFVSGDRAPFLHDLTERARRCDGPAPFVAYAITTSEDLRSEFRAFCRHADLDPSRESDQAAAFDLLQRWHPRVVDKEAIRTDVEELASRWLDGDPSLAVVVLEGLVNGKIGRTVSRDTLLAALPASVRVRDLGHDVGLVPALSLLRQRFRDAFRHLLINGRPLGRPETERLLELLREPTGPRLVLVHGSGGDGKSGVAYELALALADEGTPVLPLRLDADVPGSTPFQWGRSLDLPASPSACLAAEANDCPAVLVLDQLDAVRWTAAHSSHAWDTCERVIAQALLHPHIRVVAVCRTFDVLDNLQIRNWRGRNDVTELIVGPLDDGTVERALGLPDGGSSALPSAERQLLRSPQALALWCDLRAAGYQPGGFVTLTDLMRKYWEAVRRRFAAARVAGLNEALAAIVTDADRNATLNIPATILSPWPDVQTQLLSLNVLVRGGPHRLLFRHQSFMDHLVAERLLGEVRAGGRGVIGWLRDGEQSLFRRGQLRQVLQLLRDEDPHGYSSTVRSILNGADVRFHLKSLVLGFLASAQPPTDGEVGIVLELLNEPRWSSHVWGPVILGREGWFDALSSRGELSRWLGSDDRLQNGWALNIVGWVFRARSEAAWPLVASYASDPEWEERLGRLLTTASAELMPKPFFALYRRLIRHNRINGLHVDWKTLAHGRPRRALRLLASLTRGELRRLDRLSDPASQAGGSAHTDYFDAEAQASLRAAATAHPQLAWALLVPRLNRAIRRLRRLRRQVNRQHAEDSDWMKRRLAARPARDDLKRVCRLLESVLRSAGSAMARRAPAALVRHVGELGGAEPPALARVACHALASLCPSASASDAAIGWLLDRTTRLRCGNGDAGRPYRHARRVIRRHNATCSPSILDALLRRASSERPEYEMRAFRLRHEYLINSLKPRMAGSGPGNGGNDPLTFYGYLGQAQYVLLSAVGPGRRPAAISDRVGVLRRKFGPVTGLLRRRPRSFGGFARSPIPPDRLRRVSNRQWYRIATGKWVARRSGPESGGPGTLIVVNADAFARSLQTQVEAEPKRFAQWALGLPLDADRLALVALLHGLAKAPPPNAAAAPDRVPPTVAELWAVLDRFWSRTADREIAMATLWVIRQRPEEGWPTEAADRVADVLIRHPDPASREFNVTRPAHNGLSESRPDVVMTALNCVRGVAAGTLEELLYSRPTWIPRFRATVDRAAGDPHPSVRAAVVGLTAATLNSDRDDAVAKLLTALDGAPDEVLQTPALDHFLGHALPTHLDGLEDVVHRMSRCNLPDVARRGTAWATEIWLHTTEMEASVGKYASGNRDQRLGVADTLAAEFPVGRADGDLAIATLVSLLGDPEADVAAASGALFRDPRTFGRPSAAQLARTFVDSAPTSVGINDLLIGLKGATVPLGPFVPSLLAGVERIGGVAGDGRPHLPFAGHLAEVVLRAYGQAGEDASLRSLCLDACDGLLRYQIGYDLLRQLDA